MVFANIQHAGFQGYSTKRLKTLFIYLLALWNGYYGHCSPFQGGHISLQYFFYFCR